MPRRKTYNVRKINQEIEADLQKLLLENETERLNARAEEDLDEKFFVDPKPEDGRKNLELRLNLLCKQRNRITNEMRESQGHKAHLNLTRLFFRSIVVALRHLRKYDRECGEDSSEWYVNIMKDLEQHLSVLDSACPEASNENVGHFCSYGVHIIRGIGLYHTILKRSSL